MFIRQIEEIGILSFIECDGEASLGGHEVPSVQDEPEWSISARFGSWWCRRARKSSLPASTWAGTDFTEGQDVAFFEWLRRDKGIGRNLMAGEVRVPPGPKGLETLADYPNLTDAMLRRGWSPRRVEKIMGGNWLRLFHEVWAGS